MLLLMFSRGIPPTVGFYAKLVVLQALLGQPAGHDAVAGDHRGDVLAGRRVLLPACGQGDVLRQPAPGLPAIAAAMDMQVALSINGALVLVLGILPQYLLKLCTGAMIRTLGG
jgi:NADH-quinone oxidoreductase subunit N